mgnify:CR=1 FL=1
MRIIYLSFHHNISFYFILFFFFRVTLKASLFWVVLIYSEKIGGMEMELTVYLAGQIHDNWREEVAQKAKENNLPLRFVGPQTNHDRSDNIGEEILGEQPTNFYKDDAASNINNFRTQVLMQKADIVIALFGEKYKQWNTAMDASTAIAMNKPTIIIRPESLIHPLKELSNKANVTVETVDQAIDVIRYIFD